jgi:hypothetical protein
MKTKICSKCKKDLLLEEFSLKKGKPQSYCKSCHKEYRKQHYIDNKQKYINKASLYRKEFWEWFKNLKKDLSCEKCGESRPWVLDFHHTDSQEKDTDVSTLVNSCSKTKVLEEIGKCVVLCSNCHRDHHYQEKNVGNA